MRVAIIGAGLAGLSCAYTLERSGIKPVIYEKRDSVGERIVDVCATLALFNRFQGSPDEYFRREYALPFRSMLPLHRLRMFSQRQELTVEGELGLVYGRGRDEVSLENQIKSLVRTSVYTNEPVRLADIQADFDHVVVATGEESGAKELGVWKQTFHSYLRVAVVLGEFTPGTVDMWLNTQYCRNGYAYLLPQNEKKANFVLIVNDAGRNDFEFYWREFLLGEKPDYTIIETRDFIYNTGLVRPARIGNVLLAGNSGGFVDDLLGFGMMNAIESGCMAAQAIVGSQDYNSLTRPLYRQVRKLHEFRKALNTLDNDGLDRLLSFMDVEEIKQLIYHNRQAKATQAAFAVSLFNAIKGVRN